MKKLICICTAMAAALSGCSLKDTKTAEDMPPDAPYNRIVMETENGYYYGVYDAIMSLRYTEKSNGADIFLCAKPECSHSGEDTCTATYQFLNVSNYVLYDGSIYFVGFTPDGETAGYSLFKASPDGSSLDKVGDVRRVKYPSQTLSGYGNLPEFRIHKGYAFIPYLIGYDSYGDYVEGGFVKMDITTGKTETIFSNDDYFKALSANVYCGCGDYFYYSAYCSNGDKSRNGYFRYNMKSGESERLPGTLGNDLTGKGSLALKGITEKAIYMFYGTDDDNIGILKGYDTVTGEPNGSEIKMTLENYLSPTLLFYNDKIFICKNKEIEVYSDKGELIGQHECQPYTEKFSRGSYDERQFDISDNKLYIGYKDDLPERAKNGGEDGFFSDADTSYYYCPLENIAAGTGDWTKAYTKKHFRNYWDEDPIPKFINENMANNFQ